MALAGFVIPLLLQATAPAHTQPPLVWRGPDSTSGYRFTASGSVNDSSGATITIATAGIAKSASGLVFTSLQADDFLLREARLTLAIRATGVAGGFRLVIRVLNETGAVIAATDSTGKGERGSTSWQRLEKKLMVPEEADSIQVGIELRGPGQVEVAGLRLEGRGDAKSKIDDADKYEPPKNLANFIERLKPISTEHADVMAGLRIVDSVYFHHWFAEWAHETSRAFREGLEDHGPGRSDAPGAKLETAIFPTSSLLHCHLAGGSFGFVREFAISPYPGTSRPPSPGPAKVSGASSGASRAASAPPVVTKGDGDPGLRHALCPSWLVRTESAALGDQRLSPDTGLAPVFRAQAREERAAVIHQLDRALASYPSDNWIIGQRIRMMVDQRDTAAALAAINQCPRYSWWCGLLSGYVVYWRGDWAAADSIFGPAVRDAPALVRCTLTDLSLLIGRADTTSYAALPCGPRRDSANAIVWWLSKPLWTESANERRAAHYAREVMVILRSALDLEPIYDWETEFGGDAVRRMMIRYGAPSSNTWLGVGQDAAHQGYLGRPYPEHFTTNEYTAPRYHTVPSWAAIASPFTAIGDDWQLTSAAAAGSAQGRRLRTWWPAEHFPRDGRPIAQRLAEQQIAMFRRDDRVLLAVAADLPPQDAGTSAGSPMVGSLIFTTSPDVLRTAPISGTVGQGAWTSTFIQSMPQLMGMELTVEHDGSALVSRTRFGIAPPPTLAAMKPGEVALSDLALLSPGSDTAKWTPESIYRLMATTRTVKAPTTMRVYWETYGVAASDTVGVALRVDALNRPSIIRRIGAALHLTSGELGNVSVQWVEPRPGDRVAAIPARVPASGRTVAFNVSKLPPGAYRVSVSISRRGSPTATTSREFVIEK